MVTPAARPALRWEVLGETVRGAAHARAGRPNQDAMGEARAPGGIPCVAVVADGHGSPKSFRSREGADLAVAVAGTDLSTRLLGGPPATAGEREALARGLVEAWRNRVAASLERAPFAEEELDALARLEGTRARDAVTADPLLAYGATLLAVAVTESAFVYFQLGDGDILTVTEAGAVRRPMPADARLIGNLTTSLCVPEAWRDARIVIEPLVAPLPALVLLATDGYANSFADDAGFLQVGSDLLQALRADGVEKVKRDLPGWLEETSRLGAGDDVTLAVLYRRDVIAPESPDIEFATLGGSAARAVQQLADEVDAGWNAEEDAGRE